MRNYVVFGKFVLLRSNFGLELYLGNNEQALDSSSWRLHPSDNDVEKEKFRHLGEIAYMAEKQREALHFIVTHPRHAVRFNFHRFVNNLDRRLGSAGRYLAGSTLAPQSELCS